MAGCNFNTSHVSINQPPSAPSFITLPHFNTSHVSINHKYPGSVVAEAHFNTSHVSINPFRMVNKEFFGLNFNTSHVSINLAHTPRQMAEKLIFQYISCFY